MYAMLTFKTGRISSELFISIYYKASKAKLEKCVYKCVDLFPRHDLDRFNIPMCTDWVEIEP